MGAAIAERVLQAGFPLTVYNRTPGKTEALAALGADSRRGHRRPPARGRCLSDDGLGRRRARDGDVRPRGCSRRRGRRRRPHRHEHRQPRGLVARREAAQAAGVEYLRAPVSGNPTVVRAGNLTIIVSGPAGSARADQRAAHRDRAHHLPRRRRRAGAGRQARAAGADRRDRRAAQRGAPARGERRRRPPDAPGGDRQLGGGVTLRQVQDRPPRRRRLLAHLHHADAGEGRRPRSRLRPPERSGRCR